MKKRVITLTENQRTELEKVRDTHLKPYMRERAAAILKISEGHSVLWVAKHGLLKQRYPKALYQWLNSYLRDGLDGLLRKPYHRFEKLSDQEIKSLSDMLHRPPHLSGQCGSRWTLEKIRAAFPHLSNYTESGIWGLLKRLGLSYKRGRLHITSPDDKYDEKKSGFSKQKMMPKLTRMKS